MTAEPGNVPLNDQLLMKILQIIRENLSDQGFHIDRLAGELHISRSQLYRKIEVLTSYKPGDLIRIIRLRKAASLFREGNRNVSQVMYMVGYSHQSNFARSFKKQFKLNPAKYIKEYN